MSAAPQRILVRAPNWVGDVVMATPALRALGHAHPDAELVVEGRPHLRDLVEPLPYVDRFLPDRGKGFAALLARAKELRAARFDWAVLLPNSVRAALGPWLARVPVRAGYSHELARRVLVNRLVRPPAGSPPRTPFSMIERYLRITDRLGCERAGDAMDVPLTPEAEASLAGRVPADAPLLVLVTGAAYGSSKLWPAERFAAAADLLARERGLLPVLAPGPGEESVARAVEQAMHEPRLVLADPPLTLGELAVLCARAALVVTNDTGPRQMAVAHGVPTVVLMGPTDPRHTAHHLGRQRVLRIDVDCGPCGLKTCPLDHRCMTGLTPEAVLRAGCQLLSEAVA